MGVDTCCKYLMFFFNLLIFIGGAVLLSVGIWVIVEAESFRQIISSNPLLFNAVYIILAVGGVLLVIGFLGCCGAIQENKCMLGTFFACIMVLFLVEVVGGILAFVYYPKAKVVALESMKYYNQTSAKGRTVTSGWDTLQITFKCCGLTGIADWTTKNITKPNSCSVYTRGCESALQHYFWILGGAACGILLVELLAMIFACCMYQNA